jgi:hypothetical protein
MRHRSLLLIFRRMGYALAAQEKQGQSGAANTQPNGQPAATQTLTAAEYRNKLHSSVSLCTILTLEGGNCNLLWLRLGLQE